jgi:hypothetical protein
VSREEHKLGLKGSSTARVFLENAETPEENLLYEPGLGHRVAFNALNLGRFKLASMSLGPARDCIALASAYSGERRQFGKPLREFGLIQAKLAEMAARFYVAESMVYRTGDLIDQAFGRWAGTIEGNRKAAEEFALECSACKVVASEAQAFIVDEALQIHGGYGFTEEFPVARHYRDARVSRIYEGTNEINRIAVASRLLKAGGGHPAVSPLRDSLPSELLARALSVTGPDTWHDQIKLGALGDLVILTYAEQSSRLRATQVAGVRESLYRTAMPWLNAQAALAYQKITGGSVEIPSSEAVDTASLSDEVCEAGGPL